MSTYSYDHRAKYGPLYGLLRKDETEFRLYPHPLALGSLWTTEVEMQGGRYSSEASAVAVRICLCPTGRTGIV